MPCCHGNGIGHIQHFNTFTILGTVMDYHQRNNLINVYKALIVG